LLLEEGGGETSLLEYCVGVSDDVTGASSLDDSACSLLEDFSSSSTSLLLELDSTGESSLEAGATSEDELLDDFSSAELDGSLLEDSSFLLFEDSSPGSGVFDELLETFSLLLDETEELDLSRLSSLWMAEEEDSGSSSIAT
jgi:hypothetical protein